KLAEIYVEQVVKLHGIPSSIVRIEIRGLHPDSGKVYKRLWGLS
ncbi:hypothetical protein A2U01_0110303, partial [Trifolium medium]|nr:hypothetical protein [Trifolium medium]